MRLPAVLAAVVLAGALGAATAAADPGTFRLGEPFVLGGGQEATADGLTVRFADVAEDSRCPTSVSCFWTGQARIDIVVEPAGAAPATVELNTNPAPSLNRQTARVGDVTVELQSLDPYPATPGPIALPDYRATLVVHR